MRLPLVGRDHEFLVVWTTTPWTLPANVAAAVRADADYARIETPAGIAYVAADRREHVPVRGNLLGVVPGSELVGLTYSGPFDELPATQGVEHRVVAWDEVSMEEGTGIVHIAPGCGAEDFELGQTGRARHAACRSTRRARSPTTTAGCTPSTPREAAPLVIEDLGQRGRLVEAGELTHRYPVCWRCGTELIYRLVDEWFIRCDEVRQPMIDAARQVEWTPPQYGKRMEDWLRNMGDWCISRKRYWGLPLPFYFCDDGHMTVVSSKDDLFERAISGTENLTELHRPWIDDVVITCDECGGHAHRLHGCRRLLAGRRHRAVLDDGLAQRGRPRGAMPRAPERASPSPTCPTTQYWQQWYPADWVTEMREQIRLWFYSMLFMGVVLDGRAPYQRVLTYEKVNDETGRPMHKSWGNAIWFDDAIEEMGADVMRWMYAAQPPAQNLNFGYGPATAVKTRLLRLWNIYAFFVLYANIDDHAPRSGCARKRAGDHRGSSTAGWWRRPKS